MNCTLIVFLLTPKGSDPLILDLVYSGYQVGPVSGNEKLLFGNTFFVSIKTDSSDLTEIRNKIRPLIDKQKYHGFVLLPGCSGCTAVGSNISLPDKPKSRPSHLKLLPTGPFAKDKEDEK
jgi:hypothetical protein